MTDAAIAAKQSVRAGLVKDAAAYEWSGYGDATRGVRRAQRGLCKAMGRAVDSWERDDLGSVYGGWLATTPDPKKDERERAATEANQDSLQGKKPGRASEKTRLSLGELIWHRVRYLPRLRSPGGQLQNPDWLSRLRLGSAMEP